jgi:hypothetical protein
MLSQSRYTHTSIRQKATVCMELLSLERSDVVRFRRRNTRICVYSSLLTSHVSNLSTSAEAILLASSLLFLLCPPSQKNIKIT